MRCGHDGVTPTGQFASRVLNPKDFLVDLQTDYVTYFPADLGFSVGFKSRDYASDGLSPEDFVAEPVHFAVWGEIPAPAELARLSRIAAHLFAIRFMARLKRQKARELQHRPINEDSRHDLETNIHAA